MSSAMLDYLHSDTFKSLSSRATTALPPDALVVLSSSVAAALTTHLLVQYHEPHIFHVLILGILIPTALFSSFHFLQHDSLLDAFVKVAIATAAYISTLTTSIIVYRLYFHRLRNFPGPRAAAISKIWHAKLNSTGHQHLDTEKLHEKYGDIVRIGPNELSFKHPDAVRELYGPRAKLDKARWTDAVVALGGSRSIVATTDFGYHAIRRREWDRGFGSEAMVGYNALLSEHTDRFIDKLKKVVKTGPIDINMWFNLLAFDLMGLVGLGKEFGMVEGGQPHFYVETVKEGMAGLAIFGEIPWLVPVLSLLPASDSMGKMGDFADKMRVARIERGMASPPDLYSYLTGEATGTKHQLSEGELTADMSAIIIAGSDTTASTLTFTIEYLIRRPDWLAKLREELKPHPTLPTSVLQNLPILNAMINETLRVRPVVPSKTTRLTPKGGIVVTGRHIPGLTTVSIPIRAVMRDSRNYSPKPEEWRPERWLESEKEDVMNKNTFVPFSYGAANCAGKNLALMELRHVIAAFVTTFDFGLIKGFDISKWENGITDCFTVQVPSLLIDVQERKK